MLYSKEQESKKYIVTVTFNPAVDKTITVDKFTQGSLNRVKDIRIDSGGKGINVAKVLKNFNTDVVATGLIAGVHGEMLSKLLDTEGIKTKFLNVNGNVRTNLKIVDESTKITTEVNEPGFEVKMEEILKFKEILSDLLINAEFLILGGSLPKGTPQNIYYELINMAKSQGVKTILDADGDALKEGIKAAPFAIKPNIEELEKLTGTQLESIDKIIDKGKELQSQGIDMVIVSMGKDGGVMLDRKEAVMAKTFDITPASTVGAGDSMVAVLAYCLMNNYDLERTAQLTTAAGTITASKPGTQVCSIEEVKSSFDKVIIEKL